MEDLEKALTIDTKLKELFKDTSFEDYNYRSFDTAEELEEALREELNQEEVIYYSNAMDYLMEHDASLMASLAIAHDLGYTTDSLNSEVLATLLKQANLNEELSGLVDDIKAIFDIERGRS